MFKKNKMLIVHGGAPTSVINASLYGVLKYAKKSEFVNEILGAIGGTEGILKKQFLSLSALQDKEIDKLPYTPGSFIGTSRTPLSDNDYIAMIDVFLENNIRFVLFNGGNGTMDTCRKLFEMSVEMGVANKIFIVGIPKTIDNDLSNVDHSPGFPSAARYVAVTVAEIAEDVRSLPIHVCIIELMGRNAGWLTAASAVSRKITDGGPHLIYLPERSFDKNEFLKSVKEHWDKENGVVVCVSEGLKDKNGSPIVAPTLEDGRSVYYGDVGAYLSKLVSENLKIKCRYEKPGIAGRASISLQSSVDVNEAVLCGEIAAKIVLEEKTGVMIAINRKDYKKYEASYDIINLTTIDLTEKIMPDSFISESGNDITDDFLEWVTPLIGDIDEFAKVIYK
ncbi:MAG: diphosphate--fructose-6-phosphate 1-phosphotransferase [Saccharofermentanales bacterium]|jgi:6-phosphofructokinase